MDAMFNMRSGRSFSAAFAILVFFAFGCKFQVAALVRLVGGSDSMEGRVEVFWNGTWGTVCDDLWDLQDATVICRELGFGEAYAAPQRAAFGEGTLNILLDDVECTGNEETVFDCPARRRSVHVCSHYEDAGVRCTGDRPFIIICPSNQTIDSDSNQNFATVNLPGPAASYSSSLGRLEITIDVDGSTRRVNDEVRLSIADSPHVLQFNASDANNTATCSTQISVVGIGVRLVGGSDSMEGRVEVFRNGAWGTVCDDYWDLRDATVICRELGFGEAYAAPQRAAFGQGTGNIVLDDVECTGNEETVFDCPARRRWVHDCSHYEDAGVRCTGDRPVRIICPSNQTIDSDSNQNFATVNLPGPAASYHSSLGRLEITIDVDGSTRRVNDEVRLSIADSPHVLQFNASDANNTATCSTQISVVGIGVRLVGGSDSMEGRVEVFWNGTWGTVCNDYWDLQDATVICRELGFGEAYAAPTGAAFGPGTGDILLKNVRCRGNEETVFDCPAIRGSVHFCWHDEDAGVRCSGDRPVRIICPSNQTIESDPNQTFATVNLPGPAASYSSSLGRLEIAIDVDGSTRRVNDEVRLSIADSPHVLQFNASDANNTATCSMQISVLVNQPPVITCPPNQTIQTYPKQNFARVILPEPASASDNSGWFEITIDADGSTRRVNDTVRLGAAQSVHTLQYTARDASNNIATCTMQITVIDNEPPTFDDCPADVTIPVGSSSNQVHHRWIPPMASDNSGREVKVTFSCSGATADATANDCDQAGNGTFSVGGSTMTYRAEDASGNENVCTFTVTVTVVELVCPANVSALASPGSTSASVSWSEPDLTGWNGPTNFTSSNNSGVELLIGTHRVDYQQWFASYNLHLECSFFVVVQGQCPTNTTNDGLRWPVAVAGSTAKSVQRCPLTTANAGEPEAVRNCSKLEAPLYFRWEEQEIRGCGDKKEVSLENVVKVEVSKGNAVEVAEFLANQTSESSKEAEDVAVVASILENIAKAGSGDKEVTELVLETVSNVIMSVGPETPDSEPTQIEAGTSSAIIQSVETQISLTLQQEGKVSIRQDSIHVEAVSLEPNQTRNGLSFVSLKQSNVTSPGQGSQQEGTLAGTKVETLYSSMIPKDLDVLASARLPGNITNLLPSPNAQLQASFLIYADDTLFQSASIREHRGEGNSTRKVAGSVVSLTVENVELVNLTEPVVIEFKEESSEVHCVSWDFELEDGVGDWTTDGCALAEVTNKTVVCNCSHATNFAILVDVKGQAPDDKDDTLAKQALDIISHVGAALSIIALAITLIIYLAIRKLRSGKSRQIFINFCFSLFMLYIVFVAGVDNAKGSGGGCVFVAALLHYLTLSTMMWMAVEARNMYVSTVKVFPEDAPRYMLKACLIAWGSPLIVLIITLAAASHHYANEHYCFVEPGLVLYLGLLVPIGLILLHNIITFILVMRSLLKVKEASRSQQISKRLQNAVGISALMGLTWCFGFLAINEAAFAFQLIFCLANSLQGVVVFIMFCARREEVRTALAPYMKRICCGHECRLPKLHPEKSNESEMVSATAHTLPSAGQTAEVEISVTTPQ